MSFLSDVLLPKLSKNEPQRVPGATRRPQAGLDARASTRAAPANALCCDASMPVMLLTPDAQRQARGAGGCALAV